jgi:hypothetical protein
MEDRKMDYGKLLSRTWNLVWEHKFLILLGILVALGSSGGSSSISGGGWSLPRADREWQMGPPPEWRGFPLPPEWQGALGRSVLPVVLVIVLVGIALIVGLAVWVLSTLARGALIAGASAVDAGSVTSFGEAFNMAWRKGWTLLGIGVFPAIPALIMLLAGLGVAGAYAGFYRQFGPGRMVAGPRNVLMIVGALVCLILPVVLILNLLRTFANRACMLEGCGVFAAYARGFQVLIDNIGSALLLFLIQVGIGIVLGLVLLLPALCCVFWPLLILVQGAAAAYFSTMWTLAWRRWHKETGMQ